MADGALQAGTELHRRTTRAQPRGQALAKEQTGDAKLQGRVRVANLAGGDHVVVIIVAIAIFVLRRCSLRSPALLGGGFSAGGFISMWSRS